MSSTEAISPAASTESSDASWLTIAERGSILGIRLLFLVCVTLGRGVARAILRPLVLYYVATHRVARRASRKYLQQLSLPASWWRIYDHFLLFAEVTLDGIFLLRGKLQYFKRLPSTGFEHLRRQVATGRGAILLGAHLGNIEAMRVLGDSNGLPIYILVHTGNARLINSLLEKVNPEMAGRVVEVNPGGLDAVLKVKELVDAGKMVAILGDRVGINDKTATATFFGKPARFPTGAYLLAGLCHCPIYLTFGLYSSPNEYRFFCEPFLDERFELPRGQRESILRAQVQRYAERLEHYCRQSPLNWFNFYDFWEATT
jgi:predicted LPLAT superfamily acyltransferase